MNFLSIDVGTTCCKCQLFSDSGEILEYITDEYDFLHLDGEIYIDAAEILKRVKNMIREIGKKHTVSSVAVSTLGESFVLLDENDDIIFYPMVYTDPRGDEEAKYISKLIGDEKIFSITGTVPHSMYSVSKLLMIKNKYPEIYAKAKKALLICDYIGYSLTGRRVIDYSLAARTGAFDVRRLEFSEEILSSLGLERKLFSLPARAGSTVETLTDAVCEELGLKVAPTLVLGSHDQVCTTLGAGALSAGDAVDGMGTVECITVLFDNKSDNIKMGRQGYPVVPFAVSGLYCTYMLNYSCSSLINWMKKSIMHEYSADKDSFFEYFEGDVDFTPSGILTLPYFGGASTPYQNINAKGAVINLTTRTTDKELYKSLLEGTAMEMRLNAEAVKEYGIELKCAVATGGGSNSKPWLKIKSDIQNIPFKVLRSSEGGLCGCAMLQAVAMGTEADLFSARDTFVRYKSEFTPDKTAHDAYENQYEKYKKIYTTIKELY